MTILDKLIYEAGGYSAKDLEHASDTERRQILQLGSAVLFSILASITSWSIASTLLVGSDHNYLVLTLVIFITILIVFAVSMSLNRNLIFYSDMQVPKQASYSYTGPKKRSVHAMLYVRVALVGIVATLNTQVLDDRLGYMMIGVLVIFELYPLFLKWQIGQTILGRRIQAKLNFQLKRGQLKEEEYALKIKQTEQRLVCENCPASMNDSVVDQAVHERVRLIK